MDKNQGYAILKAVMLENGRGFALGEHPTAPSRYVTWACYDDKDGQRQYEWGHYGNDRTAMEQDFTDRVQDYQRIYNVGIRQTEAPGLYKYYSTQRPVDIGTFPKPPYNKPDEIFNYDQRIPVENGSFLAWGYLMIYGCLCTVTFHTLLEFVNRITHILCARIFIHDLIGDRYTTGQIKSKRNTHFFPNTGR